MSTRSSSNRRGRPNAWPGFAPRSPARASPRSGAARRGRPDRGAARKARSGRGADVEPPPAPAPAAAAVQGQEVTAMRLPAAPAPQSARQPPKETWHGRLLRTLLYGRNVDRTAKARARIGLAILAFAL